MIPEILYGSAVFGFGAEYWRSRRGPLVLLAVAVTHARAGLLCLRREVGRVPERWAREYRFSLRDVKEQG